jgi:hypothetical protein
MAQWWAGAGPHHTYGYNVRGMPDAEGAGMSQKFTSRDESTVWTLKIELGNRRSSLSSANKLKGLISRPLRIKSLKNVPPLPNCLRVCLLSVVVELNDIHATCTREKLFGYRPKDQSIHLRCL